MECSRLAGDSSLGRNFPRFDLVRQCSTVYFRAVQSAPHPCRGKIRSSGADSPHLGRISSPGQVSIAPRPRRRPHPMEDFGQGEDIWRSLGGGLRDQRKISDIMFNLFSLRRPSDFKKENSNGECGEASSCFLWMFVFVQMIYIGWIALEIEAHQTGPWGGLKLWCLNKFTPTLVHSVWGCWVVCLSKWINKGRMLKQNINERTEKHCNRLLA